MNDEVMVPLSVVKFAAIECRLQMSGELSVGWMIDAWLFARNEAQYHKLPTLAHVQEIGRLVEPNVNVGPGFRRVNVRVGSDIKCDWEFVPGAMVGLMENAHLMTPEGFFKDYEEVHPWRDGNGRSGVLLFNWFNGTLDNPVWAPNLWNDPRRTVGYGA